MPSQTLTFDPSKTAALIFLKFFVVTYWTLDYKQCKFYLGAPLGLGETQWKRTGCTTFFCQITVFLHNTM